MTVNSTTNRVEYSGDGSSTVFSVGFYFLADEDLKVYLRAADDSETLLLISTNYTVSGSADPSGGSVTMVVAPAAGEKLVIVRDPAITQPTDYQANDAFPAETHERALDKVTMQAQRLSERMDRSMILSETDTAGQGAFDAKSNRIGNLNDPLNVNDAATKEYVDERLILVNTSQIAQTAFGTVASASAAAIDPSIDVLFLEGYSSTGDGGHALYKAVASEPSHAAKFRDAAKPRRWWEILPINGQINPMQFGAVGNASADDTVAVQNAANAAGILGCELLLTKMFSVSTVDFNYRSVHVRGLGHDTGFKARSATSVVRSLLANRIRTGSIEGLRFREFQVDGNNVATNGFELERFTRGCGIHDCLVEYTNGDGIGLYESWSYELKFNMVRFCSNIGINMGGSGAVNNAIDASGNHVFACGVGWFVKNVQSAAIIGNTSEYNIGVNFSASGRALRVEGNYFEGHLTALGDEAREEYCVVLGAPDEPFINSSFNNYVNGGSNSANNFTGDGVHLVNVINSKAHCAFSLSTRHTFAFSETATIIGNDFDLSFDGHETSLRPASIRNLTDAITGGIDVLDGVSVYANQGTRVGNDFGIRHDYQIEPDGSLGSIFVQRIITGRAVQYKWGKISSSSEMFSFDSVDRDHYYDFEKGLKIPVMTSTERDAISAPVNGMIILNTTTGNYQGYKESGAAWVDFH